MSPFRTTVAFSCLLLLLLTVAPTEGQVLPGSRLAAIEVVGARTLATPQVIELLGLQVGAPITLAALETAAQRLATSGLVTEVSFRYTSRGRDVTATFTIVEAETGAEVIFDNFPWFSSDELKAGVAAGLPGFDGRLTGTGTSIDRTTERLQAMLNTRGIAGRVEYMPFMDTRTGAQAHRFLVRGVSLPVCDLSLTGVEPALSKDLARVTSGLLGKDYSRISSQAFLSANLTPFYRKRGYLRAQLTAVEATLGTSGSACPGKVLVVAGIAEGHRYTWKSSRWSGNTVVVAPRLDELLGFKDGEVADGEKLDVGIKKIARAYGRQGYLGLAIEQRPSFDDALKSVTFEMIVSEGPQFRMGTLTIEGVSPALEARMRKAWTLQRGTVYDADYLSSFVEEFAQKDGAFALVVDRMHSEINAVPASRIVDVTLRLPQ